MSEVDKVTHVQNIRLSEDRNSIIIIDQTQLPNRQIFLSINEEKKCYDAIRLLQIRGAPAIGIFAGYSMYILSKQYQDLPYDAFLKQFQKQKEYKYFQNLL